MRCDVEEQYDDADGYTEADVLTAARLGAYEERERSVRTLLALAAAHDLPAASVLKALSGTAAAPTDPPVDDADDDDTDDFVEAAFQLAEEAAEAGEDATDVLELLASRVGSISKAWDESKVKRNHGQFSSTGGGAKTKTGKEAGPKKPTKTEQKLQRRAEAKTAAHAHLKARASGKVLNASAAADLIGHLAHLTHADLRELRKAHGASFGGERRKGNRTASLVKWAKNELGKKRRAQQGSALQQTVDYGGIDPNSVDFKRFYGSMKDAVNDGIPMAAFKRGGNGLDEIAAQMVNSGHINLPDWEDPSEHLIGLLRGRKMLNWGDADKKHADAYAEHVAGQLDADTGATFDPNKEWDDEDPDWFSKALDLHHDATDAERLAAAVEVALAALEDGTDPEEALDRLHEHGTFGKAWDESKHPRSDKGQFVSKDAIQQAKSDPKKAKELKKRVTDPEQRKKLDAALADPEVIGTKRGLKQHETAQKHAEKVANRAKAREIRIRLIDQDSRGEELDPDDLRALIPHLSQMSHEELSHTRALLQRQGATFGGKRLRADRVAALVAWATGKAQPQPVEAESGSGAGASEPPTKGHAEYLRGLHGNVTPHTMNRALPGGELLIDVRGDQANIESNYAHEAGHNIHDYLMTPEQRSEWAALSRGEAAKPYQGKNVSSRGATGDPAEDFPEVYAAWTSGDEWQHGRLRPAYKEFMERTFGPPSKVELPPQLQGSPKPDLSVSRDKTGRRIRQTEPEAKPDTGSGAAQPAATGTSAAPEPAQSAPPKTRLQALAEKARANAPAGPDDVNTEYAKPRDQYHAFTRAVVPADGSKPDSAKVVDYLASLPDHARERLDQHFRAGGKSLREIEQFHQQAAGQLTPEQVRAERSARADAGDAARAAMGANYGNAGDSHPLSGLSRSEQVARAIAMNGEAENSKHDVSKLGDISKRPAFLTDAIKSSLLDAVSRQAKERGVATDLSAIYGEVGAKHGLTKHQLQQTVAHLDKTKELRLVSWPGMLDEAPDPELLTWLPGDESAMWHVSTTPTGEAARAAMTGTGAAPTPAGTTADPKHLAQMDKAEQQAEEKVRRDAQGERQSAKTPAGIVGQTVTPQQRAAATRAGALVGHWRHHTDKGRTAEADEAARRMIGHGAERLHAAGETVPFDGRTMEAQVGVSDGQPVRVTRHGWHMPGSSGMPLLRAQAEPVASGTGAATPSAGGGGS